MAANGERDHGILSLRAILILAACLALSAPAWCGHALTLQEKRVLKSWLSRHTQYREGTDEDCDCADDIKLVRAGSGGVWAPVPDYHPYVATGDFNSDGVEDFAVVLVDRTKREKKFVLTVFNGPFQSGTQSPAFTQSGMDLEDFGLFYGPPRPKPYRLLLGRFESDSGSLLIPHGRTYKWDESEQE